MDFSTFSGRDVIIIAVILIAVYLLVSLLHLSQIKRRRKNRDLAQTVFAAGAGASPAPQGGATNTSNTSASASTSTSTLAEELRAGVILPAAPASEQPLSHAPSFSDQLFRSGVEAELQNLRKDVAELKETLAQLTASRRVSPQYNEAMLLAQRGMNSQVIADQCAISIGEAELVVALSRNRQEYEDHDSQYDRRE